MDSRVGHPVSFSDPFGLCPDACVVEGGVGIYVVRLGIGAAMAASCTAQASGPRDATRGAACSVWAAVSDKRHKIALAGQGDNIDEHFGKLGNPNEPGGDDPNNRDRWKRDIQQGIRIMKDRLERLMSDVAEEDWAKRIADIEQKLKNTP